MQISCPQCGKMLEAPFPLPERAQCPYCAAIFSPVAPAPRMMIEPPPPPPGQPVSPFAPPTSAFAVSRVAVSAPEQVRIPAIGLMIGGVLSLLYVIFDLIFSVLVITGVLQGQAPANLPPFIQNLVQPNPMQLKFAAIFDCVKIVTCAVVIYGAVKMQRLESYGLAVTSSILSLIPCVTCCCCLGLPFGVWSLVVLNRPEVRASFR